MTAITAAAVSHTITRNCSQGGIQVMLMLMTAMTMMMVMVMLMTATMMVMVMVTTVMMMMMLSIINSPSLSSIASVSRDTAGVGEQLGNGAAAVIMSTLENR